MPTRSPRKARKSIDPCAELKRKLKERDSELKEARAQQAAVSSILRVISRTVTDVKPVLRSIAEHAMRLCRSHDARVWLVEGDKMEYITGCGGIPPYKEGDAMPITRGSSPGRAIYDRKPVHIADATKVSPEDFPLVRKFQLRHGHRTVLAVPLMHEKRALGAIVLRKTVVEPYTKRQIELVRTFANQAAIAIENVRLYNEAQTKNAELTESLEQQTATSEILRIISSSPTDTQPVFDAIVRTGLELFGGATVGLRLVKGDYTQVVANTTPLDPSDNLPVPIAEAKSVGSRAIASGEVVHVPDLLEDGSLPEFNRRRGIRAIVGIPLLRDNKAMGAISLARATPGPFTDKQIALLKTFADQAVIAIENVRLFKELQARNAEVTEALEQQTATSEVLKVISSSPSKLEPVFQVMLANAQRICDAKFITLYLHEGGRVRLVAAHNFPPMLAEAHRHGVNPAPDTALGRVIRTKQTVHLADLAATRSYAERHPTTVRVVEVGGVRTIVAVPLLKDNELVGIITTYRQEVRPFTDKQVELLQNFAAQAVIAIENVRLFKEINEALAQQTATANVLKLISRTTFELQPVLDTLLRSASELCDAEHAVYFRTDPDSLRLEAWHNVTGEYVEYRKAHPLPLSRDIIAARAALTREPALEEDLSAQVESYDLRVAATLGDLRAALCVPVLRDGEAIGVIGVFRHEVRPFSEQNIALLKTFADQAVIAIENVRLFKELQARNAEITEALEQQTATAEILKVISGSPTDTRPVFDEIAKSGVRLFGGLDVALRLVRDNGLELVASTLPRDADDSNPNMLGDEHTPSTRAILRREVVQVPDVFAQSWLADRVKQRARNRGYQALVAAPMLREDKAIGAITVLRATPGLFTDKQIALLKTFADQAVIAIENVRLFNETKEALEQQTVISEILRVIGSSPTDTQPVFDTIVKSGVHLFGGLDIVLRLVKGDHTETVAGTRPLLDDLDRLSLPLNDDRISSSRCIVRREVVQFPDVFAQDGASEITRQRAERRGFRATVSAPLLRENTPIGAITVTRATPGPFSDKEIALLKTFADQAVIAIENVRLFKELQARNAEVTEALDQQKITGKILRIISSSPTDTQPVFDAIVNSGVQLFGGMTMSLRLIKEENTVTVASTVPISLETGGEYPAPLSDLGGLSARAIARREVVQIPDILDPEDWVSPLTKKRAKLRGYRANMAAPMLREGKAIGTLNLTRATPGLLTEKQVALLKTFADQAVIAIENVRLFKELQARNAEITEALEQQTATADILKVISSSPTDLKPVFDAILENATRLCDAHMANLVLNDGDTRLTVAQRGGSAEYAEWARNRGPFRPSGGIVARMLAERRPIQIADLRELPDYRDRTNPGAIARVELGGARTLLAVPMLKKGRVVGSIQIYRPEVLPFTQKQIDLVSTFANQAVIAIENVRLFNETKEALEQQTVISEILRVISSSPTDTQPVFDAIVKSGVHLFGGMNVTLRLVKGDHLESVASTNPLFDIGTQPLDPLDDEAMPGSRAILRRNVVQVPDYLTAEEWVSPKAKQRAEKRGFRALMSVPMLRENNAIGTINVIRATPGPFTDKQIALLKTFADQAVIAIENVRLFTELQARNAEITEALEQQTATAEILRVISSSPTDTQPVFEAIVNSGARLFSGIHEVSLRLVKGDLVETVASTLQTGGTNPAQLDDESMPAPRALRARDVVQILDIRAAEEWVSAKAKQRAEQRGWRALVATPMLRENNAIGVIAVTRTTPGPFSDKQVALLKTFADQAVIAIENVRLFKELQASNAEITEALEQQTATANILKVISSSPTDIQPVFDAILENATRLCGAHMGTLRMQVGNEFRRVAQRGVNPEFAKWVTEESHKYSPQPDGAVGQMIAERRPVHILDRRESPAYHRGNPTTVALVELGGARTFLAVPMLKEGRVIGGISLFRPVVQAFSQKQIDLLSTFADQAVIAIENVRLFKELETRNRDLAESLEQQAATSEILRAISRSISNPQPVFDAIVQSAVRLFHGHRVRLFLVEGDRIYVRARHGEDRSREVLLSLHDSVVGKAILAGEAVQVPDYHAIYGSRSDLSIRSTSIAPLIRDGKAIGAITVPRNEPGVLPDKQMALLKTFADQAVIAIENARLFNEIQDKSRQLEIANRHKSQFLANMSHELRTPLNCINGFSEMLLARMFGELNEKQEEFLRDINSSGEHLLSLINDVLDLSKIEAGRMELHITAFEPGATLDNTVMLVKERAASRGITVSLSVDERLDRWVGDERKIRQVMLNLLSNSVKFTPEGGRIDVRARREGNDMVVAVSDTGIGIKPEDQARIFEEFQQAGTDYTKKAEGTGLGLALSRKFVELHGGKLTVESAEGKGSTFTFTLPEMQEATA